MPIEQAPDGVSRSANTFRISSDTAVTVNVPASDVPSKEWTEGFQAGYQFAKMVNLGRVSIAPVDRTAGCPCKPQNGGNGVCGCILGGPQVTC